MGRLTDFFSGVSMIGRGVAGKMSTPNRRPRRNYQGAVQNDLTSDWRLDDLFSDEVLKGALPIMRRRSRSLFKNNDYAKQFGRLMQYGVIGPNGIKYQNRSRMSNGKLDTNANNIMELGWKDWGKKGNCTADRKKTFLDVQNTIILSLVRDGEILIKKVPGFDNSHRFALQMLDVARLDENYNIDLRNGNKIRMSIEFNQENAPVAYHIKKIIGQIGTQRGDVYQRVDASEIIHEFLVEDPEQIRGVPFLHTAILRLRMIGGMEEATLVASRVGASSMGFFTSDSDTDYVGDGTDEEGNIIRESTPGGFEVLPAGMNFTPFDPKQPSGEFGPFLKAVLRGASAGMGIGYNSLANDLEGVNFSSLKKGDQSEKDFFRGLQTWMDQHILTDIYDGWNGMAFLSGSIDLPISKRKQLSVPIWQGRGWQGLEPLKDSTANINNIAAGLNSRTKILAAQGLDYEEIIDELKAEEELAEEKGIDIKKTVDLRNFEQKLLLDSLTEEDENATPTN